MKDLLRKQYALLLEKTYTNEKTGFKAVLYDFLLGLRFWRIWYLLGIKDIKLRYKRSKLGQVWHVLVTFIQICSIGIIWAYLFKMPVADFFPYFAIGRVIYGFIATIITDGSKYYYTEKGFLLEMPSPKSIYAYSNTLQALITFLHDFVVVIAVMLFFKVPINFNIIYFVPAMGLLIINAVWATVIFGYIGARFRDIPPLLDSVIGIALMITPIMWKVEQLPVQAHKYMILNPFYIFIKISRDALLGLPPDYKYWLAAGGITIIGFLFTFIFLRKFIYRIAFWV